MRDINSMNLVYFISFLDLFAVGLTFPLFSTHLKDLGASHFTISLLSSTYAGVQVLTGPIIGSWSDVRDRKSVLQFTIICCAILYGLLGIPNSVLIIFLIRFLIGMVKHTQTLTKAIITDIVPPSQCSGIFGKSAVYANLGFIGGPLIGGYLSEFENGFMYVSFITAFLFIINLGIVSCLPDDSNKKQKYDSIVKGIKHEFGKSVKELSGIDWKVHWVSFLLRFLFGLSMTTYFNNQALYLKEKYDLSQKNIGYTISFFGTVGMFVAYFLSHINKLYTTDKFGYTRLYHFFALASACFFCIYVSPNVIIFVICLIPLGFCSTVLRVVSMDLMMKQSDNSKRGSLSGASNSVMSVARLVSPLFAGIVGDIFGEHTVILLAVFPAVLGTVISFYFSCKPSTKVD